MPLNNGTIIIIIVLILCLLNWETGCPENFTIKNKDFTFTSLDLYRDLHCWEMMVNWIPFGNRKSYNFIIRVKSDILQDLKIEKKKNIFDSNYLSNF